MLAELNRQLAEAQEKLRRREKLRTRFSASQESLARENARLSRLQAELDKESSEVRKLEGLSLTGLFMTVLGSKEQQLERERQDYLAAKLKYDECEYAISTIEKEITKLQAQMAGLGELDAHYNSLLEAKATLISEAGDEKANKLFQVSEAVTDKRVDLRELQEAVEVGQNVLVTLEELIGSLESAGNWGTWDLIGGGLITTAVKHSKIDEARAAVLQTQQLLRRFHQELADVEAIPESEIGVEIGSFATFADYVFDGLISDWIVQSSVYDAMDRAALMKDRVQNTVKILADKVEKTRKDTDALIADRQRLIEDA